MAYVRFPADPSKKVNGSSRLYLDLDLHNKNKVYLEGCTDEIIPLLEMAKCFENTFTGKDIFDLSCYLDRKLEKYIKYPICETRKSVLLILGSRRDPDNALRVLPLDVLKMICQNALDFPKE